MRIQQQYLLFVANVSEPEVFHFVAGKSGRKLTEFTNHLKNKLSRFGMEVMRKRAEAEFNIETEMEKFVNECRLDYVLTCRPKLTSQEKSSLVARKLKNG